MLTEFILLFLAFYIWHAMGVTVGYHRLLSHRSFSCPKWVEYFWVAGGYLAFEGSPIWWATMHRAHHRHVDTALDPHSPRFGLRNAHVGWLQKTGYADHIDPHKQGKDLIADPLYRFLEQGGVWHRAHLMAFSIGALFRVAILLCFGWLPALASLAAGLAVLQIPLMLNVICHLPRFGYKNYAADDDSVNVWWVAVLAMGEGWHNNHHAAPGSAKTGIMPHEIDVSWLAILLMKKIGLVGRVNVVTHERLMENVTRAAANQAAEAIPQSQLIPTAAEVKSPAMKPVKIPALKSPIVYMPAPGAANFAKTDLPLAEVKLRAIRRSH